MMQTDDQENIMKNVLRTGGTFERASIDYLIAVTASAVLLVAVMLGKVVVLRINDHAFYPLANTIITLSTDLVALPVVWLAILIFSIVPSVLILGAAVRYRWTHPLVFALLGALIALIAGLLFLEFANQFQWYTDVPKSDPETFFKKVIVSSKFIIPAGVVGGLVFWARDRRKL